MCYPTPAYVNRSSAKGRQAGIQVHGLGEDANLEFLVGREILSSPCDISGHSCGVPSANLSNSCHRQRSSAKKYKTKSRDYVFGHVKHIDAISRIHISATLMGHGR